MSPTAAGYAAGLAQGREPRESLPLLFADCSVLVRSNSRALIQRLADYYRGYLDQAVREPEVTVTALEMSPPELDLPLRVKQPDPGKTKIKEEYAELPDGRVVRKRLTGMVFFFGGPVNLAAGPCLANTNQVINFINNRFIQRELAAGSLLAHAAAVARGGRGLALAGFSGMGKSTLALWLVSRGLDFISNDRLLIKRRGGRPTISGVAKQPRINPGTALANPDLAGIVPRAEREAFADLPPEELWALEHKYDAIIDDCFEPGRFRLAADLEGLAILNWQRSGGPCRVEEVDLNQRRDLLAAFKKEPGLFFLGRAPAGESQGDLSDEPYLQALAGVKVFEISGGVDFQTAAAELDEFLTGGGTGEAA